jgi:hypothetical protein
MPEMPFFEIEGPSEQVTEDVIGKHHRSIRDAKPIIEPDEIPTIQMPPHGRLSLRVTTNQAIDDRPLDPPSETKSKHQPFATRHGGGRFIDVDHRRESRSVQPVVQSR